MRATRGRLEAFLADEAEAGLAGREVVDKLGVFRGVPKDASDLGRTTAEIFRGLFAFAVPDLYPKLEMGSPSLGGKEAEEVLRASKRCWKSSPGPCSPPCSGNSSRSSSTG